MDKKSFAYWHGIKRSQIDWRPVINEEKCAGCGICATTCTRGVYKFDFQKRKSKVINPNNCMVACQTCANLCPMKAINFTKEGETTREKAQEIVRQFKVIARAQEELKSKTEKDNTL